MAAAASSAVSGIRPDVIGMLEVTTAATDVVVGVEEARGPGDEGEGEAGRSLQVGLGEGRSLQVGLGAGRSSLVGLGAAVASQEDMLN